MNPRAAINDLHPFQGCPFGQLGYFSELTANRSAACAAHIWLYCLSETFILGRDIDAPEAERMGFEPMRPFGQTVFKTASL